MGRRVVWASILVVLGIAQAHADAPITDRDYAIEFYDGVAIGNTAWVGMGGAGAAFIIGTAGTLINPSAPAIRPVTDDDEWSWDYHFDYLTGKYSSDYDNNGIVVESTGGASLITAGIGGRYHDWASALTVTAQSSPILNDTPSTDDDLDAGALRFRFVLARWLSGTSLAVGAGFQDVLFRVTQPDGANLFSINGAGLIGGITWVPHEHSFRVAAAIETPIVGANVVSSCDPNDPSSCMGYILPSKVTSPARLVLGFAHRLGLHSWNQQVHEPFRDEPSISVTADLVVSGSSDNSYGIEAFGRHMLQRSGAHTSFSLRTGTEVELVPGRFRGRAGSYWEPGRFDGTGGRIHITFGAELRVFEFQMFGPRRGRLSFTADIASHYRNIAASIGFWH